MGEDDAKKKEEKAPKVLPKTTSDGKHPDFISANTPVTKTELAALSGKNADHQKTPKTSKKGAAALKADAPDVFKLLGAADQAEELNDGDDDDDFDSEDRFEKE